MNNIKRVVMAKYRKKPIIVEALQLRWNTWDEMCEFANVGKVEDNKPEGFNPNGKSDIIGLHIPTSEGLITAVENDWIIKEPFPNKSGRKFYPCSSVMFEQIYEKVEEGERDKAVKILKSFFIKHGNWILIPQKEIDEVIKQIQGNKNDGTKT